MRSIFVILVFLSLARVELCCAAEEKSDSFGSFSLGHNLSSNNRTLNRNQWSLGTLYVGYGITDRWTVATSLFVFSSFEILSLITRYSFELSKDSKIGMGVSYFKSLGAKIQYRQSCFKAMANGRDICQSSYSYYKSFVMEALALNLTYSRQFQSYYRFSSTLNYYYYYDERLPFSFRMDPQNSDPYSLSLTTLHEFRLSGSFFVNFEAGIWGFNYQYPYYHTGLTLNLQNESGLIGVGASATVSPSFPSHLVRTFPGYDSRIAVHPEVQIQLFF